jgi:photosystem II stability/assembly factor-like uncharacterized protein
MTKSLSSGGLKGVAALVVATAAFVGNWISPAVGTGTSSSWTLASTWFSTPLDGYAAVTAETTSPNNSLATCSDYVGKTSNGGRTVSQLDYVLTWKCSSVEFASTLTFDGLGDGFLYGPALYETHDGGRHWSKSSVSGSVMQVVALGESVWMVENHCANKVPSSRLRCRLEVERSGDGGRTWTADVALGRAAAPNTGSTFTIASTQTVLVRPSRGVAIVVIPLEMRQPDFARSTPILVSTDGGATWTTRTLTCGIATFYVSVSVPRGGPWFAVCAGQGSAGFQGKSVVRSDNLGKTWTTLSRCGIPPGGSCSASINVGYLQVFDAVTKSLLVESGTRSSINVSHDGGRTWTSSDNWPASYGSGATTIQFFNATRGVAMGSFANWIFATTNGGRTWTNVKAIIQR